MVMTRPPAYHFWKFLMKNMIPTNSGLNVAVSIIIENNNVEVDNMKISFKSKR